MRALAAFERAHVRDDLYAFVKRAWSIVESEPFVDGWHIELVCRYLEALTRGHIKRLVINVPPSTSKSILTGVMWPAWEWLSDPSKRWFHASADGSLVNRDAEKLRRICNSDWYRNIRQEVLLRPRDPVSNFTTIHGGRRFSTSFGGRAVGWHAHRFVYDDPIKTQDAQARTSEMLDKAWNTIANVFGSRKLGEDSTDLIVMQRLHDDDPAGRALAMGGWVHLELPMRCESETKHRANPKVPGDFDDPRQENETLNAARFTEDYLANLLLSPEEWETQYQQHTGIKGGSIIEEAWIEEAACTIDDLQGLLGLRKTSWDLTFKDAESSDMVAGQWWLRSDIDRAPHFFLCAPPVNERLSFTKTIESILLHRGMWPSAQILIENKANGPAAENVLEDRIRNIRLVEPMGPKAGRLQACSAAFADRRVHLLRGPHYDRMKKTFVKFPRVRFDDEIDACTQALINMGVGAPFRQAMAEARKLLGTAH